MKKFVVRGVLALSLVGALGLATVTAATAGTPSHTSISKKTYREELASYRASRSAIEATFRASVASAAMATKPPNRLRFVRICGIRNPSTYIVLAMSALRLFAA